jgi:hypothetical protein
MYQKLYRSMVNLYLGTYQGNVGRAEGTAVMVMSAMAFLNFITLLMAGAYFHWTWARSAIASMSVVASVMLGVLILGLNLRLLRHNHSVPEKTGVTSWIARIYILISVAVALFAGYMYSPAQAVR